MIRFENRFDEYAYRIANRAAAASVTNLQDGQWVTLANDGRVEISNGTKKSFLVLTSRRNGRDNLSITDQVSYLHGAFELSVDQFDVNGAYAAMTPLKVNSTGVLTPWVTGTDNPRFIEAYALGAPVEGFLRIVSA